MDPKLARWHRKADALAQAWERRYGAVPPKHTVVLALCQPSAETLCGDAWRGPDGVLGTADDTRNWGAATLRSLNTAELAAIAAAGIVPTVGKGHEERAKAAQAAIVAAGLPIPSGTKRGMFVPRAEIHCDSTTDAKGQHAYFVWFAAFDSDDAGAEYYLTFVAEPGNPARSVLLDPKGNVYQLAAAAYARGYFWGFKPHGKYITAGADGVKGTADDVEHDGNAENITAYADWLRPHFATISAALKDWAPRTAIPSGEEDYEGPGEGTSRPQGETAPAPALLPLEQDLDERRADRDQTIREDDET